MKEPKFVECCDCSTIHYVIDKDTAESLKNKMDEDFLTRDLTRCSSCGSKKEFSIVSEIYVKHLSPSDKLLPIFLDYDDLKKSTKNKH